MDSVIKTIVVLTLYFVLNSISKVQCENEMLMLEMPLGFIRGSILKSRLNNDIYAFRGVRYAEPPIRELRFKMAVPVKPWNKTKDEFFDAAHVGPRCFQLEQKKRVQSEDCLRLDIYSPRLPSSAYINKPVIVYFGHGTFAESKEDFAVGPHYLLDHEIVFVTVNYRLGALGFLSTGDKHAPGNLGLKDQVMALRWVKKYILFFGGDPKHVTIMGHGAGAWSVSLHLVSPMSKGLFHRAIAMSGSAINQNILPKNQSYLAKEQAEAVRCDSSKNSEQIVKCLMSKKAEDITRSIAGGTLWHKERVPLWSPVVEPEIEGVERFLIDQPSDILAKRSFHHVPLLAGVTQNETASYTILPIENAALKNFKIFEDFDANWIQIAPVLFDYSRLEWSDQSRISGIFRKFYFGDKQISLEQVNQLGQMYTDNVVFQVHKLIRLISYRSIKSVFYYNFVFKGNYSNTRWSNGTFYEGVSHGDELLYLLSDPNHPINEYSEEETSMIDRMTELWTNFAKYGNPNPEKSSATFPIWLKYQIDSPTYFEIGTEIKPRTRLFYNRMNKWEQNFPFKQLRTL